MLLVSGGGGGTGTTRMSTSNDVNDKQGYGHAKSYSYPTGIIQQESAYTFVTVEKTGLSRLQTTPTGEQSWNETHILEGVVLLFRSWVVQHGRGMYSVTIH